MDMTHIFSSKLSSNASQRIAWGYGLRTTANDGTVLDTWFPIAHLGTPEPDEGSRSRLQALEEHVGEDPRRNACLDLVELEIDLDTPPASTSDAYLRLHLLSKTLVKPNSINLEGIFRHLPTVVWTNVGPMLPSDVFTLRPILRKEGINIISCDKFPRMLDYVIPERVRIADAARVRLGAYLAPGTTVMHEGFVNFNAGTLGKTMIEGRVSQGVVIGAGSDIGGGASIMGTLSGGGTIRVRVGERSLLGANAGIGISLGDDCIVEAGLYITAGTKVVLVDQDLTEEFSKHTVKASELSGMSGILFRRNSLTGAVEAIRKQASVKLNTSLHA